jgi:hypothetical protein
MHVLGFASVMVVGMLLYLFGLTSDKIAFAVIAVGGIGAVITGLHGSKGGRA